MNLYSTLNLARPLLECFTVVWLNVFDVKNVVEVKVYCIYLFLYALISLLSYTSHVKCIHIG